MFRRLVAAALFFVVFSATCVARGDETASDGKPLNAMAPLYVAFSSAGARGVTASLVLPENSSNKNWYCNWLMIVGTAKDTNHSVFVQVGIIRRPGVYSGERIFASWQGPTDANINYREYESLHDGPHTVEIGEEHGKYALYVDDKSVGSPIAMAFTSAYAQVGPEVFAEGDTLVGTVANVVVRSGAQIQRVAGNDVCRYVNHGVVLSPGTDGTFTASGVFDRAKPSTFLGNCSGI